MLRLSKEGLQLTKDGLTQALAAGTLEEVLALENRGQVICIREHMKEGATAFFEKREPQFDRARPQSKTA
jgi:1,4-dihydroxy-2-naphthoyl-CoA synthase